MSTIKIKRSGVSGAPSNLASGELAYSYHPYAANTAPWTGGQKLYIGSGVEDANGHASNIVTVGGAYYTGLLDHQLGTLTASAAIITGSDKKIDQLLVDNIDINGIKVASTGTNNLQFGTSNNQIYRIDVTDHKIINLATPSSNFEAANKKYVDDQITGLTSGGLTLSADNGTNDTIALGQTLTLSGNTGISTTVTDNQIDIVLDNTAVTAGSYGDATNIPTFTVDAQGRLTAANTVSISTSLSIAGNTGTDTVSLLNGTLNVKGDAGIKTAVTDDQILITTDSAGAASFNTVSATSVTAPTVTTTNIVSTNNTSPVTVFTDNEDIQIGKASGTGTTKINNNLEVGGNTIIVGDLTVQGNSVAISTSTLAVDDNIIFLNANSTSTSPDLGFVGTYNLFPANTSLAENAGLYYDASTSRFKIFDGYDASLTIGAFIDDTDPSYSFADIQVGTVFGDLVGDVYASDGSTKILESGTDGSDATFTGDVTGDLTGDVLADNGVKVLESGTNGTNATFTGNVTGNASTATTLETARDIQLIGDVSGTVSFNGSNNAVITTTIQADSVALGTDTTGNYAAEISGNNGILVTTSNAQTEGGLYVIDARNAGVTPGLPGVASFDSTNFDVTPVGHVTVDTIDGGTY